MLRAFCGMDILLRPRESFFNACKILCTHARDRRYVPCTPPRRDREQDARKIESRRAQQLAGWAIQAVVGYYCSGTGVRSGTCTCSRTKASTASSPPKRSPIRRQDGRHPVSWRCCGARAIAALKLDADWVILSACNTAAGAAANAEALSGLARAFIYAQARALLVSHWEVYSDAMVKLITGAVGEMASEPQVGYAQALRRSKGLQSCRGRLRRVW